MILLIQNGERSGGIMWNTVRIPGVELGVRYSPL
jgi:hypothetical protein